MAELKPIIISQIVKPTARINPNLVLALGQSAYGTTLDQNSGNQIITSHKIGDGSTIYSALPELYFGDPHTINATQKDIHYNGTIGEHQVRFDFGLHIALAHDGVEAAALITANGVSGQTGLVQVRPGSLVFSATNAEGTGSQINVQGEQIEFNTPSGATYGNDFSGYTYTNRSLPDVGWVLEKIAEGGGGGTGGVPTLQEVLTSGNTTSVNINTTSGVTFGAIKGLQINNPVNGSLAYGAGVFSDGNYVYVADDPLHRIVRYDLDGQNGVVVFGDGTPGTDDTHLNHPNDVKVIGNVMYIADTANHRILRLNLGDVSATVVTGGNGAGTAANQLYFPVAIDIWNDNLYISASNRVVMVPSTSTATNVDNIRIIGNADNSLGTSLHELDNVRGVAADDDYVYVCDGYNQRVLKFAHGATGGTYAFGDGVPGQTGTGAWNTPETRVLDAYKIAVHNGYLYTTSRDSFQVTKISTKATTLIAKVAVQGQEGGSTDVITGVDRPISISVTDNYIFVGTDANQYFVSRWEHFQEADVVKSNSGLSVNGETIITNESAEMGANYVPYKDQEVSTKGYVDNKFRNVTYRANPINYNEVAFLMEHNGDIQDVVLAGASSPQIKTGQDSIYTGLAPVFPYPYVAGDRIFVTFTYDNLGQPNANINLVCLDN